ncbi:DHA2 family efflux MFS transporter permease subunit [Plantactinospora sp. GCM10030261]|uniref:DHA2 family efflux MFS transporter permease subunit n=1 Tax=Plantactinospora sp. GCM10030261 TaxID=3273420 RepID=UPI00361BB670
MSTTSETREHGTDRLEPALRRLIAVVLLGGIMGILDGTMVVVAVDTLTASFDTAVRTVGWVSTAYLLALTVTIPVTTWAVDRWGARRLWLAGLALFLLASLASGLAWDMASLIGFRVLQGVGAGILDPLVLVLLARGAGPARAGRVMGLMGAVLPLGPVLGPVLGGVLVDGLGWRWMFLVNLPIGAVAFLLALRVVPRDRPAGTANRLDLLGVALSGPGVAALVLALTRVGENGGLSSAAVGLPLAVGVTLLIGYGVHALRGRHAAPLVDLRLFASRPFSASVTVQGLVGVATFSALFAFPLYLLRAGGSTGGPAEAGLLVAPIGLGSVLSMPVAGRLSDRIGTRGLALAGSVCAALAALALTRLGADSHPLWPALVGFAIGAALGFVAAPTMGSLYRTLPAPLVPQGSSVLYMLNQLGAAVGIAVTAEIADSAADPGAMARAVGLWILGTVLVMAVVASQLPGRPDKRPSM